MRATRRATKYGSIAQTARRGSCPSSNPHGRVHARQSPRQMTWCTGFSGTLEQTRWRYFWTGSHVICERLGMSGLELEAVGEVGGQEHAALCSEKEGWVPSKPEEVQSARTNTHVTGTSPRKRRNGDAPVGYSRRAALRREPCTKHNIFKGL
jgi:hypothetical protein